MRLFLTVLLLSFVSMVSAAVTDPTKIWTEVYGLEVAKNYPGAAELVKKQLLNTGEVAHIRYAQLLAMQGKYPEAIESYKNSISENPNNISARFAAMELSWNLAKYQDVSQFARGLIEASRGTHYQAFTRLINSEWQLKNWKEAAKYAEQFAVAYPGDLYAQITKARALVSAGQSKEAASAYQQVIGLAISTDKVAYDEATGYLKTVLAGAR
ncbi:MAG: tetratricopeptide repeat protein [Gammaproteobacteria bacterium]|nr:tetratricopeptide repeat protein [Gammaproteobacteria bacterium]